MYSPSGRTSGSLGENGGVATTRLGALADSTSKSPTDFLLGDRTSRGGGLVGRTEPGASAGLEKRRRKESKEMIRKEKKRDEIEKEKKKQKRKRREKY